MLSVRILRFDCDKRIKVSPGSWLKDGRTMEGASSKLLPSFPSLVGLTIPFPGAEVRSLRREGDLYDSDDSQFPEELSRIALDDGNAEEKKARARVSSIPSVEVELDQGGGWL